MASLIFASRGRVAAYSRSRNENDPELIQARRSLAVAKLHQYIDQTLKEAPPLLPEQRDALISVIANSHEGHQR